MRASPPYASYRQGVMFRLATCLFIGGFSAAAYAFGIIRRDNLIGIGSSLGFVVVMALAFLLLLERAIEEGRPRLVSIVDRLLVLVGYAGIMHSLGGMEAFYLVPLFVIFQVYYVVATNRKMPYLTATLSFLCIAAAVLLEQLGVLSRMNVLEGYQPSLGNMMATLLAVAGMLYVSAYTSAHAARLIERGWASLNERNAELEVAKDRALESDRLKSQFLANMSHELRTPLHHVIGFTELVLDEAGGRLEAPQREALNDVLTSGTHLLSLINDVLDLSRIESGRVELSLSEVNLPALLKGALNVARDSAARAGVTLELKLGAIPASARADERRINQVLYNLLSNAVKFTPHGGRVVLGADLVEPSVLRIQVSDTGIGLDSADFERVFTPFESIRKGETPYPGTGLGLSLAKKNVEMHGGRIWVESAGKGQGSTFLFTIPLAA